MSLTSHKYQTYALPMESFNPEQVPKVERDETSSEIIGNSPDTGDSIHQETNDAIDELIELRDPKDCRVKIGSTEIRRATPGFMRRRSQ